VQLILQRQLRGDCAKWRTVGRFPPASLDDVLQRSAALATLLEPMAMRVVTGDEKQHRLAAWSETEGWSVKK
jgi:hypothetical protein